MVAMLVMTEVAVVALVVAAAIMAAEAILAILGAVNNALAVLLTMGRKRTRA